tara:strand:+ start:3537 stop:3902 length:366 start_codon:yes stop_codon:yes gene_type:complete
MNLIIAGSREFVDYELASTIINKFISSRYSPLGTTIISGCANGADLLGTRYSIENDIPLMPYPANWEKYGKSAGYRRNLEMAKAGTHLLVFWDGISLGTGHMIDLATDYDLEIEIFRFDKI